MKLNRLFQTMRLWTLLGSNKRAEYLRKKKIFHQVGEGCSYMGRSVPLYANLIKVGNNVHFASGVNFITHDITHIMLNNMPAIMKLDETNEGGYNEKVGCIEIGDNVFIGAKTTILYDVKIGTNVIIGAGSLVNKDVPDNSVVAGIPARVIGTIDTYMKKRNEDVQYPESIKPVNQEVSPELVEWCWKQFYEKRNHE